MDEDTQEQAATEAPKKATFKTQTLNLLGATLRVTGKDLAADDVFIEPGPFSATVYVGEAARIARARALAALSGVDGLRTGAAHVRRTGPAQGSAAPQRAQAPSHPDDYVPPPVVPSARDMQRQQQAAAAAGEVGDEDFACGSCGAAMPGWMQRCPNCSRPTVDRALLRRHAEQEADVEADDPVPVSTASRTPKAPIDRTFAQRRSLQKTIQVGNGSVRVDLTDAFLAEGGQNR